MFYEVIKIETGEVMYTGSTYESCVQWLDEFADILNYTIISKKPQLKTNYINTYQTKFIGS